MKTFRFTKAFALTLAIAAAHFNKSSAALNVVTSAGADAAAIQASFDQFTNTVALGGTNNGAATGTFTNGFRRINWDGVNFTDPISAPLPPDFFNTTSARGAVLGSASAPFIVSILGNDPGEKFSVINSNYLSIFQTFSPTRLFAPIGSNAFDVTFFLPGTTTPAAVNGFGIVFTDVDQAQSAHIECFDASGGSLGIFNATPANNGLSFLGVSTTANKEKIARVRVTSGTRPIGTGIEDDAQNDLVVMDDFVYGEPQAIDLLQGYTFEKIKPKASKTLKRKTGKPFTVKGKITSTSSNVLTSVKIALISSGSSNNTPAAFTEVTKFKLNKKNTRGFFKAKKVGSDLPAGQITVLVRGESADQLTAVTSNVFTLERK
ncbi:MAG: hypothetical protein K1X66_02690 [Verrucomicrobiae bacterium]|nr:hypothetical protein [Verrucomicrobiae bacterium]